MNLRVIQRYLGHSSIETNMMYLHLTRKGHDDAVQIINRLIQKMARTIKEHRDDELNNYFIEYNLTHCMLTRHCK